MITTDGLLQAAKTNSGINSWYGLARALNTTEQTLLNYRRGRTPDDVNAAKLAELAGLDTVYVLACMAAERTKDAGLKSAWQKAAERLHAACLVLILGMFLGVTYTPDAHATTRDARLAPAHIEQGNELHIVASLCAALDAGLGLSDQG